MRTSVEGIMYPVNAASEIISLLAGVSGHRSSGFLIEVPHAAWSRCKPVLDKVFSFAPDSEVGQVFVLAPLHKGSVCLDSGDSVYAPSDGELAGSDWKIDLRTPDSLRNLVAFSDDICSEEQSLEVIAPYLSVLFPSACICWLLASQGDPSLKRIVEIIRKDFPFSPIFISNNIETQCAGMWKEAFRP